MDVSWRSLMALALTLALAMWLWNAPRVEAQIGTPCDRTVAISVAASMSQTVVAAVPGTVVHVCAVVLSADTIATTGQFVSGSTNLTGAMRFCDECNISNGNGSAILFSAPQGGALTLNAVTGAITGYVRIGQR